MFAQPERRSAVISKGKAGYGGRIRTYDQRINSPLRYRCATPENLEAVSASFERRWDAYITSFPRGKTHPAADDVPVSEVASAGRACPVALDGNALLWSPAATR